MKLRLDAGGDVDKDGKRRRPRTSSGSVSRPRHGRPRARLPRRGHRRGRRGQEAPHRRLRHAIRAQPVQGHRRLDLLPRGLEGERTVTMAQKYVGLDLGTHEVKAVLLSAGLRARRSSRCTSSRSPARRQAATRPSRAALERRPRHAAPPRLEPLPGRRGRCRARRPASACSSSPSRTRGGSPRRSPSRPRASSRSRSRTSSSTTSRVPTGQTGQALMVAVRRELLDRIGPRSRPPRSTSS
jgi:hypothetical protein